MESAEVSAAVVAGDVVGAIQIFLTEVEALKTKMKDAEEAAVNVKEEWLERERTHRKLEQKLDMMITVRDDSLGASSEKDFFEKQMRAKDSLIAELNEQIVMLKEVKDKLAK